MLFSATSVDKQDSFANLGNNHFIGVNNIFSFILHLQSDNNVVNLHNAFFSFADNEKLLQTEQNLLDSYGA